MIYGRRNPTKTKEELEFDELKKVYSDKYGEEYVILVGYEKSLEEATKELKLLISENRKQIIPKYEEGMIY